MSQPILKTERLTFRYTTAEGAAPAVLDDLTLSIRPGEFVAVLGHNGSGKSTLAKTFNAVLLPVGGRVWVEGMDTTDESLLLAIRQRVGMVFQNPDNLRLPSLAAPPGQKGNLHPVHMKGAACFVFGNKKVFLISLDLNKPKASGVADKCADRTVRIRFHISALLRKLYFPFR